MRPEEAVRADERGCLDRRVRRKECVVGVSSLQRIRMSEAARRWVKWLRGADIVRKGGSEGGTSGVQVGP